MKKLILHTNSSAAMLIDPESLEVREINKENNMIDYTYIAPCDCEVVCGDRKIKANKGDVIFKLYSKTGRDMAVIKSEEFTRLLEEYSRPTKPSISSEDMECDSCISSEQ